jgi:hypothetical protein
MSGAQMLKQLRDKFGPAIWLIASVLVPIGGGLYVTYNAFSQHFIVIPISEQSNGLDEKHFIDVENEINKLRNDINALHDSTENISAIPKESKIGIQIQLLKKSIDVIHDRQEHIEKVILTNPSKALEIPLIQRDIDNLKTIQQANIQAVKDGVDRIYDLNKWLLGAMAISIIALAVGNFLKTTESTSQKK